MAFIIDRSIAITCLSSSGSLSAGGSAFVVADVRCGFAGGCGLGNLGQAASTAVSLFPAFWFLSAVTGLGGKGGGAGGYATDAVETLIFFNERRRRYRRFLMVLAASR